MHAQQNLVHLRSGTRNLNISNRRDKEVACDHTYSLGAIRAFERNEFSGGANPHMQDQDPLNILIMHEEQLLD